MPEPLIRVYLVVEPILGLEPGAVVWIDTMTNDPLRLTVHEEGGVRRRLDPARIPDFLEAGEREPEALELVGAVPLPRLSGPEPGRRIRLVA